MREKINRVIFNCKNKQFGIGSVTTDQLKQGIDIWGTFTIEQSQESSSWRELYVSVELLEEVDSLLPGCIVPLYLDSQVTDKKFGGSKKEDLQELVIRIFNLAEKHNFGIHPMITEIMFLSKIDFRLKSEISL